MIKRAQRMFQHVSHVSTLFNIISFCQSNHINHTCQDLKENEKQGDHPKKSKDAIRLKFMGLFEKWGTGNQKKRMILIFPNVQYHDHHMCPFKKSTWRQNMFFWVTFPHWLIYNIDIPTVGFTFRMDSHHLDLLKIIFYFLHGKSTSWGILGNILAIFWWFP